MSKLPESGTKNVFITGAASGIGRETAVLFAQAGYRVALVDLKGSDLEGTAKRLSPQAGRHVCYFADVALAKDLDQAFLSFQQDFGRLDAAVNNAGIDGGVKGFLDCSESDFDRVIAVNLKGTFLCLQRELQLMSKQRKGNIVNVSSVLGVIGSAGLSVYSASKHGVIGLTRSLGAEFASRGIRINAVCPGGVETPMIQRARQINPPLLEMNKKRHPIGRYGSAEEIGRAIVWLCSEESSFVVGHGLVIDGGFIAS